MRIGGLAIGYDLGRKGRRLSFAPACVDVVRWEYNKKMHCDVVFPSGVGLVQPLSLAF